MVALGTMCSFVIFSSLNDLKLALLTGPLRVSREAFLEETFYYSLPYVLKG